MSPSPENITFDIEGMSCASCASAVERPLARTPGVQPGRFEFTCGMGMRRGSLVVK